MLMTTELFGEEYFLRGEETGLSNFTDYKWMPEKTTEMVRSIIRYLGIERDDTVLDFGCARGYMVKAFRRLDHTAYGVDTSEWALANADPEISAFLHNKIPDWEHDFTISKDTFEHLPYEVLDITVAKLLKNTRKAMFIVVPLTAEDFCDYICDRDESDSTHIVRFTLPRWLRFLQRIDPNFVVNGSYYIPGIKEAAIPFPCSCGFFTCKRLHWNN